eukprot:GHVQ01041195.1.p1 GENE.GHVQ01041195.1~~GHVQ01041195.1.p1  ORF type:complete len:241 (-),score=54.47 GHVQ01041195.1:287-1009(-)
MGNTMSCFERWGKRQPDGALLTYVPGTKKGSSAFGSLSTTGSTTADEGITDTAGKAIGGRASTGAAATAAGAQTVEASRSSRRRPTYSTKRAQAESSVSEFDDVTSEEDTEGSQAELSASDIRQKKLNEFRKSLTKIVKLKTAIFQMTVKVTLSKDGLDAVWFSGKSDQAREKEEARKPIGKFPVAKISAIKAMAGHPKSVEVSLTSPNFENYHFSFKTQEDREEWQQQLESLRKFLSML